MKRINIANSNISTTVLAFGTSALVGSNTREESLRLLETAYEEGIRHFDTARVYGSGDAEDIVGEFAKKYRDSITLTTKFGLMPMRSSPATQTLKAFVRKIMRLSPAITSLLRRNSGKAISKGTYDVPTLRTSLETSLNKLQTDRIDCFLLHDCIIEDCTPEVGDFLQEAVFDGKIRAFGIGTNFPVVLEATQLLPNFCNIVQFGNNVLERNIEKIHQTSQRTIFTHSSFSSCKETIHNYWKRYPRRKEEWAKQLDLDLNAPDILAALLLNYTVSANSNGIVLFSSNKLDNIRTNVRVVNEPPFSNEQLYSFVKLVASIPHSP